jgi:hypothetical protein
MPQPNKTREDWMSPLNKIIWLNAFRAKKKSVMLRDGRRFTIDYDQIPGKAWVDGTNGEVCPCGWFDLKRVTNDLFLSEGKKDVRVGGS